MKIIDCAQGSESWLNVRAGVPTASEFDNLVTPEWKERTGQMPETYMYRKLAERLMGKPLISAGSSFFTEQGQILEREALPWFSFETDMRIDRVGFVTTDDGRVGCSPDGLIGEDGGIECKCPAPDTHLKYLLAGELPKEYRAQVHGSLYVTGRAWWIFMSYCREFPPLTVRVARDEKIMAALKGPLDHFLASLDAAYAKVKTLAIGEDERPLSPDRAHLGKPLVFPMSGISR